MTALSVPAEMVATSKALRRNPFDFNVVGCTIKREPPAGIKETFQNEAVGQILRQFTYDTPRHGDKGSVTRSAVAIFDVKDGTCLELPSTGKADENGWWIHFGTRPNRQISCSN